MIGTAMQMQQKIAAIPTQIIATGADSNGGIAALAASPVATESGGDSRTSSAIGTPIARKATPSAKYASRQPRATIR